MAIACFAQDSSEEEAFGTSGMDTWVPPDFLLFVGRFHPLIVHLPIGILSLLFLMEIANRLKRYVVSNYTILFTLFFSFITAIVSALLGYFLSLAGGYDADLLYWHQWSGIALAVLCGTAYLLKLYQEKQVIFPKIYFANVIALFFLFMIVGHFGGSLTHGSEYLTEYWPFRQKTEKKKITDVSEALLYVDVIQPIFDQKCVSCHNAEKNKGELRLDSYAEMLRGGKDGQVMIAGKTGESHLFELINLDPNNEDVMPPKGKTPLSSNEIKAIGWWIEVGLSNDKKVKDFKPSEDMMAVLKNILKTEPLVKSYIRTIKVEEAKAQDLLAAKKNGLMIVPIARNKNLLQAVYQNAEKVHDNSLAILKPFTEQLTWLDLNTTQISDSGLAILPTFKNLTKLYLQNTSITDRGLVYISKIEHLEYLNIYGTKITDGGLKQLSKLKELKTLYIWQTNITEEGIKDLRNALPNVIIEKGRSIETKGSSEL